MLKKLYQAPAIEKKWQKIWEKKGLYATNLHKTKHKYYLVVMFPYPSGDKLHVGHWYNFGGADSYARLMRMQGHNVLEPMGFDSFGLPAENFAIKTGVHPVASTASNCEYMRHQLRAMGTMYDWSKEVVTSDPAYYQWTQWVFLELYKKGLAYRREAPVNFCPGCQTVLANEQVKDGACERCDTPVIQKNLKQWFLKITDYADDLLRHDGLDWPEKTILMQRNWIGRSEGINISYSIESAADKKVVCFTTRPDTNFGATFIVVAPDSDFVKENLELFPRKKEVAAYVKATARKSELERIAEGRKKTGVFTGWNAVNTLTGRKMPIYVSDFVLATVGTGAVVGVPGHDLRDFEFAKAFGIPIIRVVVGPDGDTSEITRLEQVQEKAGNMVNSEFLNGLDIQKATVVVMDFIEKNGWGKRVVRYRLRDWLISRQRYWGAPIPIIVCEKCGDVPVPVSDLPVLLPEKGVDYQPKGKAPLASVPSFLNVKCPKCGSDAEREADTMDTFMCSSWYFLRYLSPDDKARAFDSALVKKWMPVDMYIGGPEHACMHLLYARFIYKVLMKDRAAEPFRRLVHQGLVTKDGAKMSKSRGNVVSPDAFVEKYGSDVFRMYLMFMGPFSEGGDWNDRGISGIARFVERFYGMVAGVADVAKIVSKKSKVGQGKILRGAQCDSKVQDDRITRLLHQTIRKVTADIERFQFNTALAALMEFTNAALKETLTIDSARTLTLLIAPLAPHLAEELWDVLGGTCSGSILGRGVNDRGKFSVFNQKWPEYNPSLAVSDEIDLVVQVNGKTRGKVTVSADISSADALAVARAIPNVARHLSDITVQREVYVKGRLVNFVGVPMQNL